MEKAKGHKSAVSPIMVKTSPVPKFVREEVIERKIKKLSAEAIYFVIAFAVLALFVGLFGTVGVMAAANKGTVPYYRTNSQLTGSKNVFNNGDQLGIGSVMYNFKNRNPLSSHKEENGVLTIDGDIKLAKIKNVPIIKEDRLYNLNGDLWWNASKIGIWSGEVLPTSTPTTTFPSITTMGKVGIGTLDPKLQLHVKVGNAGGYPAFVTSADMLLLEGGSYSIMQMLSGGTGAAQGSYIEFSKPTQRAAGYIGYINSDNAIVFGHNGGNNENLRITGDGHLVIPTMTGVAPPNDTSAKLHFGNTPVSEDYSSIYEGGNLYYNSSKPTQSLRYFTITGGKYVGPTGTVYPDRYVRIKSVLSVDNAISAGGAINAGNSITASNGNITASNGGISASSYISAGGQVSGSSIYGSGDITAGGDVYARGVKLTSDARLKENVCMINDSLDKIKKLDGVSFNFKNNKNQKELGFIAQEVEKVLPELVGTDTRGYKTLNYEGIIPVLVNAMKEQQQQIDELKAEVEELKANR